MNINKILKRIGLFFLNILGISSLISCIQEIIDTPCMYGVPGNYFDVSGIIFGDTDGNGTKEGVSGINVTVKSKTEVTADEEKPKHDIVTTDENGEFSFRFYCFANSKYDFEIIFTDEDGLENGSFETKNMDLNFTNEKPNTKSDFGNKFYSKKLGTIELENKSNSVKPE